MTELRLTRLEMGRFVPYSLGMCNAHLDKFHLSCLSVWSFQSCTNFSVIFIWSCWFGQMIIPLKQVLFYNAKPKLLKMAKRNIFSLAICVPIFPRTSCLLFWSLLRENSPSQNKTLLKTLKLSKSNARYYIVDLFLTFTLTTQDKHNLSCQRVARL